MGILAKGYKPTSEVSLRKGGGISTVEDLTTLARESGVPERKLRKITTVGEDPEKIFSGGMVSDIFDVLNAIDYGVVGLLQGKTFKEGVKTRASFTKQEEFKQYGVAGTIAGLALDIAVDPLTWIAPETVIAKVGKVLPVVKGVKAVVKGTEFERVAKKVGDAAGVLLINKYGADPVYKEMAERMERSTYVGQQNLLEIAEPLTKLDPSEQIKIAEARKLGQQVPEVARPAFEELDKLGQQAVDAGLLSREVYEKNVGKYLPRLYKTKEIPAEGIEKMKTIIGFKPTRITSDELGRFKARKDIPDDVKEAMGEILEAGYPTAKGLVQLKSAVEKANFFKEVAGTWGSDIMMDGLRKLPETKGLGALSGKYVPTPIWRDLNEMIRTKTGFEKITTPIVGTFKFAKVILNPSTHIRNIISNFILNDFAGLSPARLDIYAKAGQELITKGKYYQEARKAGLGLNTYAAQELKDLLVTEKGLGKGIRKTADKLSGIYQKEEEFAKMAQYIFQREKGLTPDAAWKIAEQTTFNYAQVTPAIRRIRESIFGYPFITFAYKVTPRVVETALKKPQAIAKYGKIKNAIENISLPEELQKERATESDWMKNGFYVKLPIKDKYGRSSYLDLSYIIPFGDFISGAAFERQRERETGLKESVPEALVGKLAFVNVVKEILDNKDFYGNKIYRESDPTEKQIGDVGMYIIKFMTPPEVTNLLPGGYYESGERKGTLPQRRKELEEKGIEGVSEYKQQLRTRGQEWLRRAGLKIQPVKKEAQEKLIEAQTKKILETLAKERGGLAEFTKTYIPKKGLGKP